MVPFLSKTAFVCIAVSFGHQQPHAMSNQCAAAISELAGWHARATDAEPFSPSREDLSLAVLRSKPTRPSGFTLALPRPVQWRIKSPITCRPIDKLVVPAENGALVRVSVYNWNQETTELHQPVDGHRDLPSEIKALLALAEEAVEAGRPKDEPDIVRRVEDVLG